MNSKPFTRFIVQALRILLSAALLAGMAPVSPVVGQALPPAPASEHAGAPRQVEQLPLQEDPPLVVAPDGVTVDGPATGELEVSYPFIATVTPISATLPVTYVWQASGQEPVIHATLSLTDTAGLRWAAAIVQNTTATAGSVQVEFHGADGARVGEAYTIALPAGGSVRLDLHDGGALPAAALEALGEDFVGSLIVTPTAGVEVIGVSHTFWGGEGRASGYAAFPLP